MRIPRWASSRQALTLSAPPPHPRQDPLPTRDSTSHIEWTQGSQFLAALVLNNNILCLQVHRRHFPSCVSLLPGLLIILSIVMSEFSKSTFHLFSLSTTQARRRRCRGAQATRWRGSPRRWRGWRSEASTDLQLFTSESGVTETRKCVTVVNRVL